MENKLKRVSAWIDVESKSLFVAKAKEMSYTESGLLGLIVRSFLGRNHPEQVKPAPTETKDKRLGIFLTAAMKAEVEQRAREAGMSVSSYGNGLLMAHLKQKPYFTAIELDVLRQSNNELTAIGRNINQIARALNTSIDNTHLINVGELEGLAYLVKENRNYVRSLMRANLSSWGIEHGTESY